MCRQARDFVGQGCSGGEQQGKGSPGKTSAMRLAVLGSRWWLLSRLSVATHSHAGSFLVAHAWLSQEGFQQGGSWEDAWTGVPVSFRVFLTLESVVAH